jgi:GH24 family phage-related lysozyme (muramidase)
MTDAELSLTDSELEAVRRDREGLEWLGEAERSALETVQPKGAPSNRMISDTAFNLIVEFEVSSEQTYTQRYRHPVWPQGQSGVTIGIGYDVGYASRESLHADFDREIPAVMVTALERAINVTGAPAAALARDLVPSVDVPWPAAISVHRSKVLPRWIGIVERALPNTASLGPAALGALVSLTYNRGASFTLPQDRYREMRAIKAHMAASNFAAIPADIRAMKRLWPDVPGLQKRREREALLFERDQAVA